MTQLANRRYGYKMGARFVKEATRYNTPLSLIMFDIDYFKKINDTYGHSAGDKVLFEIAEIVKQNVRELDVPFRYGGEEFVICVPNSKLSTVVKVIERINTKLNTSPSLVTGSHVTVSSGVVDWDKGESFESLIKRADVLMYKAKEAGRNCIKTG